MTYETISTIIATKALPDTKQSFKLGITLLASFNRDRIFERFEETFDGVDVYGLQISEFIDLLNDEIDDMCIDIGITFTEDATLIHKVNRLIFLTDVFRISDTEFETCEEMYADEFVEHFGTTMGYEIDKIFDADELYIFHKYRETKELYMNNANNKSFSRAFTSLLAITGNIAIPEFFNSVDNLEHLNLEYFKNIPFREMSDEQVALSIILVSILIDDYREISHYDREEFFLEFTKRIDESRVINIIRHYTSINAKYHGEVIV